VAKRQRTAKTAAKQGKMSPKLISDSFLLKLSFCNAVVPHQNKKKKGIWPKKIDLHRRDCVTNQDEFNFFQCISPALWRHFLWRPVDWLTPI